MVKLIMGLKGSGKTKTLVELVKQAVEVESGNVVCIEKNKALTYDIPYTVRLINGGDYAINSFELMKGFLCGLHAGNYDITHIFIDNFFKMVEDDNEKVAAFLAWLDEFSTRENVSFTISATKDPATVPDSIKKFF
ncbi:MAG: hypothetical protein ACOX7K_05195 [Oscillospiraceae bacterium]|jgi:hypothetical protein